MMESTVTPANNVKYELTYYSDCETGSQCIYAVEVGCINSENPCLGKPQVLFKLAQTDAGPKPPILYSSWSPDGQQIAVVAPGVNGRTDIFVGNSTGTVWTNITKSSEREWEISWSPDGQSFAFTAKSENPDDPIKVFSISPRGENRKQLLQLLDSSFTNVHSPSWSPDGKRIVFMSADHNGNNQIYVTNIDGTNLNQITKDSDNQIDPRFSPNGEWIIFRRETNKTERVSNFYLIRPDGTNEHQITGNDDKWKVEPNWSPRGGQGFSTRKWGKLR
jgi:TolB protein